MKTTTSEDLRWELTRIAKAVVAGNRVVVTHRGKPSFALVPLSDLEKLEGKPADSKPKRKPRGAP